MQHYLDKVIVCVKLIKFYETSKLIKMFDIDALHCINYSLY